MSNFLKFKDYARRFLRIQTKTGELLPFEVRDYQERVTDILDDMIAKNLPIRMIILKARQMGISTLVAAYFFYLVATNFNKKGVLIADVYKRTQEVFGIYRTFLDQLNPLVTPMLSANNTETIDFQNPRKEERREEPGLKSRMRAETAHDEHAGRSGTAQLAHLTEHAYYPGTAAKIDEGLGNSIPIAPGTIVIIESTANGKVGDGAAFFHKWTAAENGDSNYIPIFIAWFEADDYELDVPKDFKRSPAEKKLAKRFKVITNRKMMWRRAKIKDYGTDTSTIYSPDERFAQDFPCTPEEAFLDSGNPVFDIKKLNRQIEELRKNPVEVLPFPDKLKDTTIEDYQKFLEIYEYPKTEKKPVKKHCYVIGGDIAEGLEGGDFSTMYVLNVTTWQQVASFHGTIDPDLFGKAMIDLAKFYNNGMVAPECNNMGHTTVNTIKKDRYFNVYIRLVQEERKDTPTKKIGWRTTAANKLTMLAESKIHHRDNTMRIRDIRLLREMASLSREADGGVILNSKDRVVGMCIAVQAAKQAHPELLTPHRDNDRKKQRESETRGCEIVFDDDKNNESQFD